MDRRVARHESVRKYPLLALKSDEKPAQPLLPILSNDSAAVSKSPLAPLAIKALAGDDDLDEAAASLLNPVGPWYLETALQVPDCSKHIRFSSKHRQTNMAISHWLKVVMRVERGDDTALDSKGRRKQFDIIIETPLHLLNCRVNTQLNTLPTYAAYFPISGQQVSLGSCKVHGAKMPPLVPGDSAAPPSILQNSTSISGVRQNSGTSATSTPRAVTVDDTLLGRNIVFDRLVSGQESEAGETPPTYDEALRQRMRSKSRPRPPLEVR